MRFLPRFTVRRLMVAVEFVAIICAIGSYGDHHRRPAGPILGTLTGNLGPLGLFDDTQEELLVPIPVALASLVVGSIILVRWARRREGVHRRLRTRARLDTSPA